VKKKIFSILFATVLLLSMSLVTATAVAAQDTLYVSKWTEDTANPIFDPAAKAYYPTVVKVSDNDYMMWFGSDSGVGCAASTDGMVWVEGPNPVTGLASNANHPLVEYYAGGFAGVNSGDNPSGETMSFRMWYWPGLSYSINDIRYAESIDGMTWYNDQPLQNGAVPIISGVTSWNRGSYGPCDVLYNPGASNTGTDWVFTMYYDGTTGGSESIGLGFSSDGIVWTGYDADSDGNADPVLEGSGSGWDATYVSRCTVMKEAGTYIMWFSGGDGRMDHGIGYATSSDGITWTKDANNPLLYRDDGLSWRNDRTYCPAVIKDGDIYKMWFSGKDTAGNYAVGYATTAYVGPDYTTIQAAINNANTGDIINVAPGYYTEHIVIDKPLTLRGATYDVSKNGYAIPANYAWDTSVESVINHPNPAGGYDSIVDIVDVDDVTFEGFVVQELNAVANLNTSLVRVYAHTRQITNIVVRNNVIGPNTNVAAQDGAQGRMGLYIVNHPYGDQGVVNSTFSGNKIFDCQGNGNNVFIWSSYYAYGAPGPASMSGTVIEQNEISGAHRSGIETAGGFSDLVIRNNDIFGSYKLTGDTPDLKYGNGILMVRGSSDKSDDNGYGPVNVTLENNAIHDNDGHGAYMGANNQGVTFTDNDIYNNGQDGIIVDLIGNYYNPDFETTTGPYTNLGGSQDVQAQFNNIYNNGTGISVNGAPSNGFVFDATNNWWGDASGPVHASNTAGSGDSVSDTVDFSPWLGAEVGAETVPIVELVTSADPPPVDLEDETGEAIATVDISDGNAAQGTIAGYIEEDDPEPGGISLSVGTGKEAAFFLDIKVSGYTSGMAQITVPYPDADDDGVVDDTGIVETTLGLYYWDEATVMWRIAANSMVNTVNNTLSGDIPVGALTGTPIGGGGYPADEATVAIESISNLSYNSNDIVKITITTQTAQLGAATIDLSYDNTVIKVLGGENTDFDNLTVNPNIARFVANQLGLTGVDATGGAIVAGVRLKAVSSTGSSSPLTLTVVTLKDNDGIDIPVGTVTNGTASIGGVGDANLDGQVDVYDCVFLARAIAGIPGYTVTTDVGDVNGDGTVDAFDCTYLARHIAGIPGYEQLGG
jgi:hypothetical protein